MGSLTYPCNSYIGSVALLYVYVCLILLENGVDGGVFCGLTQEDLEKMLPNKLGFVKKLVKVYHYCI